MANILSFFNTIGYYLLYAGIVVAMLIFCKRILQILYLKFYAYLLTTFALQFNKKMGKRKEELFSDMKAMAEDTKRPLEVLEIGAGSGANFEFYPKGSNITCIDPNPYFDKYLTANIHKYPDVNVNEFVVGKAEDMSQISNSSIDAVVCTLVLCTVDDVDQCLREIKRILRPGGKFFFMEHVRADDGTTTYTLQKLLAPLWYYLGDGCQLRRESWKNISASGFSKVDFERKKLQYRGFTVFSLLGVICSGFAMK